jgi:hypothetical protein
VASDPSLPAQDAQHDPAQEAAGYAQSAEEYLQSGRRDVAELYARAALETDPRNAAARALLDRLASALRWPARYAATMSGTRYLLIREWSQGFWSDVDHVLGMCLLAEITGRTPLVWWGAQSRFSRDTAVNAWEQFFEPVSVAAISDLAPAGKFPAKWQGQPLAGPIRNRWSGAGSRLVGLELMDRDEAVVVSDFHTGMKALLPWLPASHPLAGASLQEAYRALARKYLRPRPEIMAEVERFAAAHFRGRPLIGVHLRGSDKVEEVSELEAVLNRYFPIVEERLRARPDAALFLLTDDERVRRHYEQRYGDRLVATACARSSSNIGVHYMADRDPQRIGVEVMVDTYLAARCDEFIGLGFSNVSLYASYLKVWPPGSCLLLDTNAHEVWNVVSLLMDAPPGAG